jgi:hypothetical protein
VPLKILSHFQAEEEFMLEPGDMLYLPPHYAHDGVAMGECMTYSVGFRSPAYQELGESFLEFMMDTIDLPGRYADPDLKTSAKPAELQLDMMAHPRRTQQDPLHRRRHHHLPGRASVGAQTQRFLRGAGPGIIVCSLFPGRQETAWRCIARRACCIAARTSSSMANPSRSIAVTRRSWHAGRLACAGENRPRPGLRRPAGSIASMA